MSASRNSSGHLGMNDHGITVKTIKLNQENQNMNQNNEDHANMQIAVNVGRFLLPHELQPRIVKPNSSTSGHQNANFAIEESKKRIILKRRSQENKASLREVHTGSIQNRKSELKLGVNTLRLNTRPMTAGSAYLSPSCSSNRFAPKPLLSKRSGLNMKRSVLKGNTLSAVQVQECGVPPVRDLELNIQQTKKTQQKVSKPSIRSTPKPKIEKLPKEPIQLMPFENQNSSNRLPMVPHCVRLDSSGPDWNVAPLKKPEGQNIVEENTNNSTGRS